MLGPGGGGFWRSVKTSETTEQNRRSWPVRGRAGRRRAWRRPQNREPLRLRLIRHWPAGGWACTLPFMSDRRCVERGAALVTLSEGMSVFELKARLNGRVAHIRQCDAALGKRFRKLLYGVEWSDGKEDQIIRKSKACSSVSSAGSATVSARISLPALQQSSPARTVPIRARDKRDHREGISQSSRRRLCRADYAK